MFYINHLSIRIKLEDVIRDIEYEQTVLENIRRCNKIVGKQFKVIFRNDGLSSKECKDFVKRNEKMLFEINTQITSRNSSFDNCWFLIDVDDKEKCKRRYHWRGNILAGIAEYIKMVKHFKKIDGEN